MACFAIVHEKRTINVKYVLYVCTLFRASNSLADSLPMPKNACELKGSLARILNPCKPVAGWPLNYTAKNHTI